MAFPRKFEPISTLRHVTHNTFCRQMPESWVVERLVELHFLLYIVKLKFVGPHVLFCVKNLEYSNIFPIILIRLEYMSPSNLVCCSTCGSNSHKASPYSATFKNFTLFLQAATTMLIMRVQFRINLIAHRFFCIRPFPLVYFLFKLTHS